jgi:hypothetical protein
MDQGRICFMPSRSLCPTYRRSTGGAIANGWFAPGGIAPKQTVGLAR